MPGITDKDTEGPPGDTESTDTMDTLTRRPH